MKFPKVNKEICIGCGLCVDMCPAKAIIMDDSVAVINEQLCNNCQACVQMCPVKAIYVE